jgi:hypothetical protein
LRQGSDKVVSIGSDAGLLDEFESVARWEMGRGRTDEAVLDVLAHGRVK